MNRLDLDAITKKWLNQCAAYDGGILGGCTCPDDDPRSVILQMVNHLDRIYDNHNLLLASTMGEAVDELELLQRCRERLFWIREKAEHGYFGTRASTDLVEMIPSELLTSGLDNQVS